MVLASWFETTLRALLTMRIQSEARRATKEGARVPMSDPALDPATETGKSARWTILAIAGAQAMFWLYTIYYVIARANPKGDGFELVAIMPMSLIFLVFVLPAFLKARAGRSLKAAAILCLIGLAANFFVWAQILSELAPATAR